MVQIYLRYLQANYTTSFSGHSCYSLLSFLFAWNEYLLALLCQVFMREQFQPVCQNLLRRQELNGVQWRPLR